MFQHASSNTARNGLSDSIGKLESLEEFWKHTSELADKVTLDLAAGRAPAIDLCVFGCEQLFDTDTGSFGEKDPLAFELPLAA
jgi:hypothetical protein